jgi:hypothetical protein
MSDTPRTDRQVQDDEDDDPPMVVHVEFARELERDLATARARVAALEAERDRLADLRRERDDLWLSRERMRVALEQIQNGEAIGGIYGHAAEIARAALAGVAQEETK